MDQKTKQIKRNMEMKTHYIHTQNTQREGTHIKMAHCNQYFCCLYHTVYNKKRSIYRNQYPLSSLVNLITVCYLNRAKTFFFEEWVETLIFLFLMNFCLFLSLFFFYTPNTFGPSNFSGGKFSGCGKFIVLWQEWKETEERGESWDRLAEREGGCRCSSGSGVGGGI